MNLSACLKDALRFGFNSMVLVPCCGEWMPRAMLRHRVPAAVSEEPRRSVQEGFDDRRLLARKQTRRRWQAPIPASLQEPSRIPDGLAGRRPLS